MQSQPEFTDATAPPIVPPTIPNETPLPPAGSPVPEGLEAEFAAFKAWKAQRVLADQPTSVVPLEYYVHLAYGDVRRVKVSDFTPSMSINGGHFETDGKVFQIVGVYPVEERADSN
jgi:hypothetical protein